jgi:hypothetical protein
VKGPTGEYLFEILWLKDKRSLPVLELNVYLHEKRNDCLIVAFEKKPDHLEAYESEYAPNIVGFFFRYKKKSTEVHELLAAKAKPR